jgi:hypothetical protein
MSLEEATVSSMWEIAAIVEVLERKGLCTKPGLYDLITEFRRKNPRACLPETAFPEPCLLTETENMVIDDILELLNKHGRLRTSHKTYWIDRGESLRRGSGWRRGRRTNKEAVMGLPLVGRTFRAGLGSVRLPMLSLCPFAVTDSSLAQAAEQADLLDINTATAEQLKALHLTRR